MIATIYNEFFGIGTSTRTITGGIYSLETLNLEWSKNNNSSSKRKLSHPQFIANIVATLDSFTGNTYALALYALEEIITKSKRSIFGIWKFIKHLQKGVKLNGIVLEKITQKYMVTD